MAMHGPLGHPFMLSWELAGSPPVTNVSAYADNQSAHEPSASWRESYASPGKRKFDLLISLAGRAKQAFFAGKLFVVNLLQQSGIPNVATALSMRFAYARHVKKAYACQL